MATEIIMPKLSDTMEEGVLVSWKKSTGERVERGDIIAEVQTDKANMELESFASGILLEIRAKAGDVVAVGTVIAIVGDAGEKPEIKLAAEGERREIAVETPLMREEKAAVPEQDKTGGATGKVAVAAAGEEKASPLVRRLAREKGIDLGEVQGTGPDGRILRENLEKYIEVREKAPQEKPALPGRTAPEVSVVAGKPQPFSRMRAAIARNVTSSWHGIPHFCVRMSVDMGEAEALRRGLKERGIPLSINDLIIKAAAMALEKYPVLNASFSDEGIIFHPETNVGIAVSVEGGLLVPVVRGCEKLSLKEIAEISRGLIERAGQGTISEHDITGGTFTVSNLGMFGVEEFSAIIHPNQAAILAVAAILDTVVIRDNRVVNARMMQVTLSADHRLVDGVDAAKFLSELKKILETPCAMLV
ncbi:MAG: aceF [Geobacteraceae bacterium]|nr:aceF [Geobacteraceae bacterium]